MTDPVNVPGTFAEYPNWQRKVTASIEDMAARDDIKARLAEINRARLQIPSLPS
jgi:4-alpha-glucanotransferase